MRADEKIALLILKKKRGLTEIKKNEGAFEGGKKKRPLFFSVKWGRQENQTHKFLQQITYLFFKHKSSGKWQESENLDGLLAYMRWEMVIGRWDELQ